MVTELDVLKLVSERLTATQIQFMLTGSFALAFYATPRMTRDLDLVVRLSERDVSPVIEAFSEDMFDTARKIVDSSLPNTLSRRDRRLANARRLYNKELPEAALNAFADWQEDARLGAPSLPR